MAANSRDFTMKSNPLTASRRDVIQALSDNGQLTLHLERTDGDKFAVCCKWLDQVVMEMPPVEVLVGDSMVLKGVRLELEVRDVVDKYLGKEQ